MNIFKKLELIKDGWKNVAFMSPSVEKLAHERAKICSGCPFAVKDSWLEAIGKLVTKVDNLKCSRCNCPISAKTRSVGETCPEKKW